MTEEEMHEPRTAAATLSALRHRGFRYYWTGAFVSSTGSWIQTAALLWFMQVHTGSSAWVGAVNLTSWVPILVLGPLSGSLSDRLSRWKVIVVTQAVMMAASVSLGALLNAGYPEPWAITAVCGVTGVAYAFFVVAWTAAIPDLVPREELLDASALNALQFNLARFIGPAVGGVVLLWSVPAAFYINALTFAAFIALILVSRVRTAPPAEKRERIAKDLREGITYVKERPWLIRLLVALGALSFFGYSFIVLLPAYCAQVLHRGEGAYCLMLGMTGLGALVGTPLVAALDGRVTRKTLICVSAGCNGLLIVLFGFIADLWPACLVMAGLGASFLVFLSTVNASVQENVDHPMMGRVMGYSMMMYIGMFSLGGLALGILTDVGSLRITLVIAGAACLLEALILPFMSMKPDERNAPAGDGE